MVFYTWKDDLKAGVPLGGIGTGKLEINNKGKLVNVTIFSNFGSPIEKTRGFHIFVLPEDSSPFFLEKCLRIYKMENYESDELTYEGKYPFMYLRGKKGNVNAELEGFSAIIPNNIDDSNIPAAGFKIKISGSKRGLIAVSFPNIVGSNSIGRINEKVDESNIFGVMLKNNHLMEFDPRNGEVSILASKKPGYFVIPQFNINVPAEIAMSTFIWKDKYESETPWISINKREYKEEVHEVTGFWDDPAGMIILPYEENEEVKFVISWYARGKWIQYPYGFYYHKRFSNSLEVGKYFLREFDRLEKESKKIQEIKANLPDWLKDAIINSSYILTSNTILDDKGRFGLFEAPEVCPCVSTIAALCYEGSLPIVLFFPSIEKGFLKYLAGKMKDGYVPHDLGLYSLDLPIDGTTAPPRWKDTNPTFILLIYRYYKFTGDIEFLKEMYPKMLEAFDWELKQDKDGDGVPELEGSGDTGFDVTPMKGISSYLTSLYIASILALRETASILGDNDTKERMNRILERARAVYSSLFNGKYFIAWKDKKEEADFLLTAQVFGEWWAEILGLEEIIDEDKISSALDYLLKINGNASKYCTPNMVKENGEIVNITPQAYSSWPRMVFAIGWLGYKRNKKWLDVVKKEWDNLIRNGIVWNQPSRINSKDGKPEPERYLDHYLGNASIWSFIF